MSIMNDLADASGIVRALGHTSLSDRLLALAQQSAERGEPVAWMKPHPKCDSACLFQCTHGFTQFPECATQQPPAQQEPVAFYRCNGCGHAYEQVHPTSCDCMEGSSFEQVNYYTSPPAREWVGLTDGEIKAVNAQVSQIPPIDYTTTTYARAVEAKLKEKNT